MKVRAVQENDFFAINELMLEVNQADSGENMESVSYTHLTLPTICSV